MFSDRFHRPIPMFGAVHLTVIALGVALAVLVVVFRKQFAQHAEADRVIRLASSGLIALMEIVFTLWSLFVLRIPIVKILPLEMCTFTLWLTVFGVAFRNEKLIRVSFFWALSGATMAVVISQCEYTFPHFRFFHYFLTHVLLVVMNLYMVAVGHVKIRFRDTLYACGILLALGAVIFPINQLFHTNYMFLHHLPQQLDALAKPLGRYGYLPVLAAVIFSLFFLLYGILALCRKLGASALFCKTGSMG